MRLHDAKVYGVGRRETKIEGHGMINLVTQYGERSTTLRLEHVNFIPSNKYNILSLGRWETNGCLYVAEDNELTLYNKQQVPILKGSKVSCILYKFMLQ